jgi:hypothetical protein
MKMDFSHKGEVQLTMPKHMDDIRTTYDVAQAKFNDGFIKVKRRRSKNQLTPAPTDIFVVNEECKKLPDEQWEVFIRLETSQTRHWSSNVISHQEGETTRFGRHMIGGNWYI